MKYQYSPIYGQIRCTINLAHIFSSHVLRSRFPRMQGGSPLYPIRIWARGGNGRPFAPTSGARQSPRSHSAFGQSSTENLDPR
ncbi:hypothetical protein GDO78_014495 [Eleutherodactylus coqui]|uniref:Uncharacterized protein n=1 Tax=Eleutherodactylus coqui TaxID=57060 RepID=A0A8J6BGR8_ELECQ|nr:hypothetical protein GDO78_014495 [Eleutherodactylus coqui]